MDSMGQEIDGWLAQMPTADRSVEELRQRVGRLSRLFDRLLDRIAADHRISRADWTALAVIIRAESPCTPSVLAENLELTSGTVSTRIKRLTAAGLIENDAAAVDARSRPIRATPAGHELWRTATSARTEFEGQLVRAVVGNADLAVLNHHLASVVTAFEAELGQVSRHDVPKSPHRTNSDHIGLFDSRAGSSP